MKLLILILALLSTKVLGIGFLTPTTTGTTLIEVLSRNELRFRIGQVGQLSTISGELDILPEHVNVFGWLPVHDGGTFTVFMENPDGSTGTWVRSGPTGEVTSGNIAPGHYKYRITSDSNVADVYWQLVSVGIPDSGSTLFMGLIGLGALVTFRHDAKRS